MESGFTITSGQILAFCSFIIAVWGVVKIAIELFKEITKGNKDLKAKVEEHEEKLKSDNERLEGIEESTKMILKGMSVLINHNLTGNGIENMKKTRDELQEYLIKNI